MWLDFFFLQLFEVTVSYNEFISSLIRCVTILGHIVQKEEKINPLPKDKILDWSKFKTLTDDKINDQKLNFVLERVENILGKRRKCWLLTSTLPTIFSKTSFLKVVKSRDCVVNS